MVCICKGFCDIWQNQLVLGYSNGQKYCGACQMYIKTEEFRCSCCHNILRRKKRHNKNTKYQRVIAS